MRSGAFKLLGFWSLLLNLHSAGASTFGMEPALKDDVVRFVARLTFLNQGQPAYCSGTLISNDEVLTAGHCLTGPAAEALKAGQIFVEFTDQDGKPRRVQVARAAFRFEGNFDIGVAFLSEAANFRPEGFPQIATAPCSKRSFLYPIGFGLNEKGEMPASPKMTIYREVEGNEEFLAGVSASLARNCFGDSGGPVVCEQYGRPVIASVNSKISGDLMTALQSYFKMISGPQICEQMESIYGIRLHSQKRLLTELRARELVPR